MNSARQGVEIRKYAHRAHAQLFLSLEILLRNNNTVFTDALAPSLCRQGISSVVLVMQDYQRMKSFVLIFCNSWKIMQINTFQYITSALPCHPH